MMLFAQDAPIKTETPAPGGPLGNPMFLFVMVGIFFVVMIWLPSRKQRKEQATMLASIKVGTKVVTASGIIGTILKLKDGEDEIVIKSEDAKLKVTRASIVRVLGIDEETK